MKTTFISILRNVVCASLMFAAAPYAYGSTPQPITKEELVRITNDPENALADTNTLTKYVGSFNPATKHIPNRNVANALLRLTLNGNATINNNVKTELLDYLENDRGDDFVIRGYRHAKDLMKGIINLKMLTRHAIKVVVTSILLGFPISYGLHTLYPEEPNPYLTNTIRSFEIGLGIYVAVAVLSQCLGFIDRMTQ